MVPCKESIIGVLTGCLFCVYHIADFFEGQKFHEFHKSIAICENFTLKIFPTALPEALPNYFKHVKSYSYTASPRAKTP